MTQPLYILLLISIYSTSFLAHATNGDDANKTARTSAFEDHKWSLFFQDIVLHQIKYFPQTFNDNNSTKITRSALIKRFAIKYKVRQNINIGTALNFSVRDEALIIDDVEVERYHPVKMFSLYSGYRIGSFLFSSARLESWVNVRANAALSSRFFVESSLQSDLEFLLVFPSSTLVSIGVEFSGNRDKRNFYALQYGFGWRF